MLQRSLSLHFEIVALGVLSLLIIASETYFTVFIVRQIGFTNQVLVSVILIAGFSFVAWWGMFILLARIWRRIHHEYVAFRQREVHEPPEQATGVYGPEFGQAEMYLGSDFVSFISAIVSGVIAIILLTIQNTWPLLWMGVAFGAILAISFLVGRRLAKRLDYAKSRSASLSRLITNADVGLGRDENRALLRTQTKLVEARLRSIFVASRRFSMPAAAYSWFSSSFYLILILALAFSWGAELIDARMFALFSGLALILGSRLNLLFSSLANIQGFWITVSRLRKNFGALSEASSSPDVREAITEAVIEVLREKQVAMVTGASGVGKSTSLRTRASQDPSIAYIDPSQADLWEEPSDLLASLGEYCAANPDEIRILIIDELLNSAPVERLPAVLEQLDQFPFSTLVVLHDATEKVDVNRYRIFTVRN